MTEVTSNFDCPICGSTDFVEFYGLRDCNHTTCGICAIKLSVFEHQQTDDEMDYSKCVICKKESSQKILAEKNVDFSSFDLNKLQYLKESNIYFENNKAKKFYYKITEIKCNACSSYYDTTNQLADHVMAEHKTRYCELCLQFHKCLPSEYPLYKTTEYHQHRNKQHPKCKFCDKRFYDESHLIKHVRDSHFLCDICHRRRGFVAFVSQKELLHHYFQEHHVCDICRKNNQINVFDNEYNLKVHRVASHNCNNLLKEGLVNINYGNNSPRMNNNRRDNRNGDVENDIEIITNAPQVIPELHSEDQFPRLGGATASSGTRLGSSSKTEDRNDFRQAFDNDNEAKSKDDSVEDKSIKNRNTERQNMAENFAVSVKKSRARYSETDFPSLNGASSITPTEKPYKNDSATKHQEDDYPSLKKVETAPKVNWAGEQKLPVNNTLSKKLPMADEFPALTRPLTASSNTAPKWGNIVKNSGKSTGIKINSAAAISHSAKPTKTTVVKSTIIRGNDDFPELSESKKPDSLKGIDYIPSDALPKQSVKVVDQSQFRAMKYAVDNATTINQKPTARVNFNEEDFPSFSTNTTQPKSNLLTCSGKAQIRALNNALKMSKEQKNNAKKVENKFQNKKNRKYANESDITPEPVPQNITMNLSDLMQTQASVGTPTVRKPDSLKGITYIPNTAAPTKDSIKVVDASQFKSMKNNNHSVQASSDHVPDFSINDQDEFPAMSDQTDTICNTADNKALLYKKMHTTKPVNEEPKQTKINPPNFSSDADFPDLMSMEPVVKLTQSVPKNKPMKQVMNDDEKNKNKKLPSPSREQVVESEPVYSLSDAACSVLASQTAAHEYFPSADFHQLNDALSSYLNENGAGHLLGLLSQYRYRKITASELLRQLSDYDNSATTTNTSQLAVVLPLMITLLPEIPLQRALKQHLPSQYQRCANELADCQVCGQITLVDDMSIHLSNAHINQQ